MARSKKARTDPSETSEIVTSEEESELQSSSAEETSASDSESVASVPSEPPKQKKPRCKGKRPTVEDTDEKTIAKRTIAKRDKSKPKAKQKTKGVDSHEDSTKREKAKPSSKSKPKEVSSEDQNAEDIKRGKSSSKSAGSDSNKDRRLKREHSKAKLAESDHGSTRKHDKKKHRKAELPESESEADDSHDMTSDIVQQYRAKAKKFIKNDNMFGFVKVLSESPLASVLENMHYIFVAASNNDEMIEELTRVNSDFNIVSKKFIRAVKTSEDCRHKYAESEEVAESIQNNTPLKQIEGISEYTPEFIIMKTIQTGDLVTCNLMLKKWKIAPMFAASKHLIAAFFGWEDFFGHPERFTKSQDLIVHALCGGYKRMLRLVCGGSGSKWVLPETLEKAGSVLRVRSDMEARFEKLMADRL